MTGIFEATRKKHTEFIVSYQRLLSQMRMRYTADAVGWSYLRLSDGTEFKVVRIIPNTVIGPSLPLHRVSVAIHIVSEPNCVEVRRGESRETLEVMTSIRGLTGRNTQN